MFFDAQAVRCAQLLQPDGVVVPEVRLLSCELQDGVDFTLKASQSLGLMPSALLEDGSKLSSLAPRWLDTPPCAPNLQFYGSNLHRIAQPGPKTSL